MKINILICVLLFSIFLASCTSPSKLSSSSVEKSAVSEAGITTVEDMTESVSDPESSASIERVYVSGSADIYLEFDNLDLLIPSSVMIVRAEVVSQETYYYKSFIHTLSQVKITKVYKGDVEADTTVNISQTGGYATYEEWVAGTEFEPKESDGQATCEPNMPMAFGINDYYPVEIGDDVLLFLQDPNNPLESKYGEIFSPLGGHDGVYYSNNNGKDFVVPLPYRKNGCYTMEERCKDGGLRSISEENVLSYLE
ncbi:MAG: hypothetical protein PHP22_10560 [Oscillospiraceae bacterium]|nr:hypothetical protein [Oscillospiraceae bacterium]